MARWMAGLLVLGMATGGCVAEAEEETARATNAAAVGTPLVIHMAFVQKADGSGGTRPDGAATARLVVNGVENIMTTSQDFGTEANNAWKAAGGKLSAHMPLVRKDAAGNVTGGLLFDVERGVDPIQTKRDQGFDYVSVDELEPGKAEKIVNGGPLAKAFKALLEKHSGRVILYGNTYNMIGVPLRSQNRYARFKGVLDTCAVHCKAFASQIYLATGEAFPPNRGLANAKGCANGLRCIGWTARQLESVAPGIKGKLVTILDVRARNKPPARDDSYCTTGGRGGALQREVAKIRVMRRNGSGLGFGTYSLNTLNGESAPAAGDVNRFVTCAKKAAASLPGRRSGAGPLSVEVSLSPADAIDDVDAALDNDPEIANDWDPDFDEGAPAVPAFPKPSQCGLLKPGEALAPGDAVTACDGLSFLVNQGDGNVVLYEKYPQQIVPVWATGTDGRAAGTFVMQGDGNIVLYGPDGEVYWHPGTNGNPGARLQVQDDCKVVVATTANAAAWASSSRCRNEGVDANDGFVLSWFKAFNPDVVAWGNSHGWSDQSYVNYWSSNRDNAQCRQASPAFHAAHYLAAHPDVNSAYGGSCAGARAHWLSHGNGEGRGSSTQFDPRYYLAAHPDIANAYGPHNWGKAAWHYIRAGYGEGRRATP